MSSLVTRKIVDTVTLVHCLRDLRAAGQRVVHCHGCFDIVHPGHIRYLQSARQFGDILVVSVTGDGEINKGHDRPYIPEDLRAENLAALEFVDWVVIDPHPTACALLERLRPDVYVKGREYAGSEDPRFVREKEIVERHGGRVMFHSGDVVFSSTRLIDAVGRDEQLEAYRLAATCRRAGIDAPVCLAAIEDWRSLRVVVVGDAVREQQVLCDARDTADDAPILSLRRLGETSAWAGAAGVAQQVAALGAAATLITTAPAADGAHLQAAMSAAEVACNVAAARGGSLHRTTFVADETKLFRTIDGAVAPLDTLAEQSLFAAVRSALQDAHLLIWADYGFGTITPGLAWATGAAARRSGALIAGAAPGGAGSLLALRGAHLLTGLERHWRDAQHDMQSGLSVVAMGALREAEALVALISLHRRGLVSFDARVPQQQSQRLSACSASAYPERLMTEFFPSGARRVVDSCGAEEAVIACGALALAAGASAPLAAYLASLAEALVVADFGRAPVDAAALRRVTAARPELSRDSRFLPDIMQAPAIPTIPEPPRLRVDQALAPLEHR